MASRSLRRYVCGDPMKRAFLLLVGWLAMCAAALGGEAVLNLTKTIALPGVEGRFDHFAIDETRDRLYIAALGNNSVEVIDLKNGELLQSVKGVHKPTGVACDTTHNRIYIGNGGDGSLKVLDGQTLKVVQDLRSFEDADNVRFHNGAKQVFLGYSDGAVAVIDPLSGKTVNTFKLPAHPESFQPEQHGSRIFVNIPDAQQVAVINRQKSDIVQTWSLKLKANYPMALDEADSRAFIGFRQPARLGVFEAADGRQIADLGISGDTDDLFYDATRKRIYISCGEGFVDVIEQSSPDSYKQLAKIPTAAGARTSYFSAARSEFYLAVPHRDSQPAELRIYKCQ